MMAENAKNKSPGSHESRKRLRAGVSSNPVARESDDINGSDVQNLGRPLIDQAALNLGSDMTISTASSPSYSHSDFHFRSIPDSAGSRLAASQGHNSPQDDNANEEDRMSRVSTYSYRTDIDASRFLRNVEGRAFNALNETYFLPYDEGECIRLNKRHVAFVLALGGLYPAAHIVDAILAPQDGEQKRILDLGTGTGIWAIDMAKKFPHCQIVGIDLVPVSIEAESIPSNCQFEIDDVELGLQHFQNRFDLVHARLLAMGLRDFQKSMIDIHSCLKPGGIVIWMEPDQHFFTSDIHVHRPLGSEAHPDGTWIGRILYEMKRAGMRISKSDFAAMERLIDGGIWGDSLIDPETWRCASLYLPIGPWANHEDPSISQRLKYIGALHRQDLYEAHKSDRPLLERAGWSPNTVSDWARRAVEEISSMRVPVQARFRLAWGRRRMGKDKPAPPLPSISSSAPTASENNPPALYPPYPLLFIYDTQEKALAEAVIRTQSKATFTEPPLPTP